MRKAIYILMSVMLLGISAVPMAQASTRAERRLVTKGNKLYTERKFVEAESVYQEALRENPQSTSARYNLGLSQLRQVKNLKDSTPKTQKLIEGARQNFTEAARNVKQRPGIAAKANYNLGNMEFNMEQYQKAIDYYKQSLRIDPDDDNARRNLRIAQKKLQQQNQDKDKDKDKQNQNQDQQDKKDQQDQKNQQQQQPQQQEQKQQPQEQKINEQTAQRILQAMDSKENQTRARVNRAAKGEKSIGNGGARKRW